VGDTSTVDCFCLEVQCCLKDEHTMVAAAVQVMLGGSAGARKGAGQLRKGKDHCPAGLMGLDVPQPAPPSPPVH
jgi:hypothetical protein